MSNFRVLMGGCSEGFSEVFNVCFAQLPLNFPDKLSIKKFRSSFLHQLLNQASGFLTAGGVPGGGFRCMEFDVEIKSTSKTGTRGEQQKYCLSHTFHVSCGRVWTRYGGYWFYRSPGPFETAQDLQTYAEKCKTMQLLRFIANIYNVFRVQKRTLIKKTYMELKFIQHKPKYTQHTTHIHNTTHNIYKHQANTTATATAIWYILYLYIHMYV